jgi:diguanylate cyclase (GGDEF)-like protein
VKFWMRPDDSRCSGNPYICLPLRFYPDDLQLLRDLSALAEQEIGALQFASLDKFKPINDRFGHAEGDRVLAVFANIMWALCRQSDIYGWVGGDEFAEPDTNQSVTELMALADIFRLLPVSACRDRKLCCRVYSAATERCLAASRCASISS